MSADELREKTGPYGAWQRINILTRIRRARGSPRPRRARVPPAAAAMR